MPRDANWSDLESDADDWDEDDFAPAGESTTTECMKCGCEIYDDASRCPLCGEYQVGNRTLTAWQGRPLWWKIGGLLGILAVMFALLAFCF